MECPICYRPLGPTTRSVIALECGHKTCLECAVGWVVEKKTCPICRKETEYFNRRTRSQTEAKDTLQQLRETIHAFLVATEIFSPIVQPALEISALAEIMQTFVLERKALWRRPEMCRLLKRLVEDMQQIFRNPDTEPYVSSEARSIFRQIQKMQ